MPPSKRAPKSNAGQIGVSPTSAQKLIYVSNKLGLPGISGMQGATFNIFDTVALKTNALPQVLDFFVATANKSLNFSNLQNGTLNAGEALIMEDISFFLVKCSAADLTQDSTIITDVVPLAALALGVTDSLVADPGGLKTAQMTINIGNQTVAKDDIIYETLPDFNPRTGGISGGFVSTAALPGIAGIVNGQNKIPLEATPVLPPNLKLKVSLRVNPVGTVAANTFVMCVIGRFGSIFASKTTL